MRQGCSSSPRPLCLDRPAENSGDRKMAVREVLVWEVRLKLCLASFHGSSQKSVRLPKHHSLNPQVLVLSIYQEYRKDYSESLARSNVYARDDHQCVSIERTLVPIIH